MSAIATDIPREIEDALCGLGLAAGGANVVMQLAHLPVGHGVAKSTVDSGRVDKHPLKRARTTAAFLTISMLGTEDERLYLRSEIARAHRHVHSQPTDEVAYNAFDPELQLWVAACLYKGAEDVYRMVYGEIDPARLPALYAHGAHLGTTLQVTEDMWPADRDAFEEYWQAGLARIEMDALTREYLRGIVDLTFVVAPLGVLGRPLRPVLRPVGRLLNLGFLPQEFRDELGLPWTERDQRRFERMMHIAGAVTRALPRPLRQFPLNVYLASARRRIRKGRRIV